MNVVLKASTIVNNDNIVDKISYNRSLALFTNLEIVALSILSFGFETPILVEVYYLENKI